MKRFLIIVVLVLTAVFSFSVLAQDYGSNRKGINISIPEKIQDPLGNPLPAGSYTVGVGGDFSTIDSAFNKLSVDGIAGPVTLELIDNLYTAPTDDYGFLLNGPIPGADENNRVTIKPGANKNVAIEGSGGATVTFLNTSFVTVDGVALTGSTTLTFHTYYNSQFAWNDCIVFLENSDHNIVQDVVAISEDIYHWSAGIGFYTSYGSQVAPDSNLIQNNFVKKAGWGIFIGAPIACIGNVIRENQVGSESDTLITWGIQLEHNNNAIVEANVVQNINQQFNSDVITCGINSYSGNGCKIRNNIVHSIRSSNLSGSVGILLSGGGGSSEMIYNNMIYDIQSTSPQSNSRVAGIEMWSQNSPKVYYNTVYLSGTGSNQAGSAAFYIYNSCSSVDSKNNILINTRDESSHCASAIYDYTTANLTSDYNDLYYDNLNPNNCVVRIGSTNYNTLAEWQAAGGDLNSVTEMPSFVDPYLHIDSLSIVEPEIDSGGTPIAGIDSDIDGDPRDAFTPDMGADEFIWGVPVELISFTSVINGKDVLLIWSTATETNNRGFEIERSRDNLSFEKIGFVPGFGTSTEPKNYSYSDQPDNTGKYYYRLKQIDYDGSYSYTNAVEVEWSALNSYLLEQNYPNPFNPATTIGFGIQSKSKVKITIINSIGEKVAVILNEEKEPGYHTIEFNASALPSGVYFYQIKAGSFIETKKMVLMK